MPKPSKLKSTLDLERPENMHYSETRTTWKKATSWYMGLAIVLLT
jgi:hypothetical protein